MRAVDVVHHKVWPLHLVAPDDIRVDDLILQCICVWCYFYSCIMQQRLVTRHRLTETNFRIQHNNNISANVTYSWPLVIKVTTMIDAEKYVRNTPLLYFLTGLLLTDMSPCFQMPPLNEVSFLCLNVPCGVLAVKKHASVDVSYLKSHHRTLNSECLTNTRHAFPTFLRQSLPQMFWIFH